MGRPAKAKITEDITKVASSSNTIEEPINEKPDVKSELKKRKVLKKVPLDTIVEVRSNYYGSLIYVSSKNHCSFEWNQYGDMVYMTVDELMAMRNSQRSFFENNWISLEGEEAQDTLEFLQVDRFYMDCLSSDEIDMLFDKSADEIITIISKLASGQKETIARIAYDKIKDKTLDSISKIEAIEKSTGFSMKE